MSASAALGLAKRALDAQPRISLARLGLTTGSDIAATLNTEIASAAPGTEFLIPPVSGADDANTWLTEEPIVMKTGITLAGGGADIISQQAGSMIKRTGNFRLIEAIGDGGGVAATAMVRFIGLRNLLLDGDTDAATVLYLQNVSVLRMMECIVRGSGAKLLHVDGQLQDSLFFATRWDGGGLEGSSIPAMDIDETNSPAGGHNQNIVFFDNTWESYDGRALHIHGTTGESLKNAQMDFISCKFESPNQSATLSDILIEDSFRINLGLRLLLSKGSAASTKNAQVELFDSEQCRVEGTMGHQAGGSTLTYLVDMTGTTRSKVDIRAVDSATIGNLGGAMVVNMPTNTGNTVLVDYYAAAGSQKPPTQIAVTQKEIVKHTTIRYEMLNSPFWEVVRTNAAGTVQNSNRAIAVVNASTTYYNGWDASNHWCGNDTADLNTSPKWRMNNLTGINQMYGLSFLTGVPASAAAAGVAGQWAQDASFIYICTATNTWKRAAISTW